MISQHLDRIGPLD